MKRPPNTLILGWGLLAAVGCGRKGPLEPPFSRIPAPIEDVVVSQRGEEAILEWTNPGKNIDGHPPVDIEAVEIWAASGPAGRADLAAQPIDVEKTGRLLSRFGKEELASLSTADGGATPRLAACVPIEGPLSPGADRVFSLRVQANGKKFSGFSSPVVLTLRACALPPEAPAARVSETGVELCWSPPQANIDGSVPPAVQGYTVYRSEDGRTFRRLISTPLPDLRFEDTDVKFGSVLRYVIRTASTAETPYLESGASTVVELVPRDVFPPAPPEGLIGIAEDRAVSLSWKAGPEGDLAGYRVWRRGEGMSEEVLLTPEALPVNTFRDFPPPENRVYIYSVSALDRDGNESGRSRPAVVRLREDGQ